MIKPYKFVFRIRERYFDLIVIGEKKIEYRKDKPFWVKRIIKANQEGRGAQAVFICGKRKHVRWITFIERMKTPAFSEQGKKDVDTPECFGFHLGDEVVEL